jgi:hypothetical protein
MKNQRVRIYVQRTVGHTSVSLECPADEREKTVEAATKLLNAMPESSFTGDGVAITSIPMHGPDMDGPMGFRRVNPGE